MKMKHPVFWIILICGISSCNNNAQSDAANHLIEQSETAITAQEYQQALNFAQEALDIYNVIPDTLGMAKSYYLLARASALAGDFDNAVKYGETGSKLCKAIKNYPLEFQINSTLSWAYFTLGRDFDETMEHQKRQLFIVDKLNDDEAKAMVYNNYGYDATVSGSIPLSEAIEYMELANDYYAKTENNNGRWYTLMNLTWQHRLINDLSKSEEYGRLAVAQAKTDEDRHAILEANTNLGETLLAQNKLEEAKAFYESALAMSQQEDDRDKYVFDAYYSRFLWKTGKRDEAIASLKTALDFLGNSEIFYEMLARAYLADYYYSTGQKDLSAEQVNKFDQPRANYFSQESGVIACAVKAQLVSGTNREKAFEVLDDKLQDLDKSGAELLKMKLLEVRDQL